MKTRLRGRHIPCVCYASAMRSVPAVLAAVLLVAACGPASRSDVADPAEALRGLPPRTDPPLALDDDDDLGRSHALFRLLPPTAAERPARRKELWQAYRKRIDRALAASRTSDAFILFSAGLGLWEPHELRARAADLTMASE